MWFLIIVVLLVGLWIWWKLSHYNDSDYVKQRIKGRPADQVAVIRYFCNTPSLLSKKPISDAKYDEMVQAVLARNDFRQKALAKIGLDEDQLKEVEPVHFEGYVFDNTTFAKLGQDNLYRSAKYQVSWLFFSTTQVYLYQ